MTRKAMKELDRLDDSRCDAELGKHRVGEPLPKLRRAFLGKAIDSLQAQGTSVILSGTQATDLRSLAPFLLFYPTLTIEMCVQCPASRHTEVLTPLLDRGLASILFSVGSFEETRPKFGDLVERYQEYFAGSQSWQLTRFYGANPDLESVSGRNCLCEECIQALLEPSVPLIRKAPPKVRRELERVAASLSYSVHNSARTFARQLGVVAAAPTPQDVRELSSSFYLANHMISAAALRAVPQISATYLSSVQSTARDLRIDCPPEDDLESYLDLICKYRGSLSSTLIPLDPNIAVTVSRRINEEVAQMAGSRRAGLAAFVSRLVPGMGRLAGQVVKGGQYGAEAMRVAGSAFTSSNWGRRFWANFLAKSYYRVSPDAIHVWGLRKDLAIARRGAGRGF
jgi:hypothetical protein